MADIHFGLVCDVFQMGNYYSCQPFAGGWRKSSWSTTGGRKVRGATCCFLAKELKWYSIHIRDPQLNCSVENRLLRPEAKSKMVMISFWSTPCQTHVETLLVALWEYHPHHSPIYYPKCPPCDHLAGWIDGYFFSGTMHGVVHDSIQGLEWSTAISSSSPSSSVALRRIAVLRLLEGIFLWKLATSSRPLENEGAVIVYHHHYHRVSLCFNKHSSSFSSSLWQLWQSMLSSNQHDNNTAERVRGVVVMMMMFRIRFT